jgi:putative transposase
MTAPRQVLAGTTYLVTRRCAQREYLLNPSAIVNGIFLYVLAAAAQRFGIDVHAVCVLSNHFHLIVTDPDARLPAFEQYLDSLVARAVNASLGRWEAFWAPSSYSAVPLLTPEDVVDKTAYVLANPVAAGLVRRGRDWPGLWTGPEAIGGEPIEVRKPDEFFRRRGPMPDRVQLQLSVPPGFSSPADFRERLVAALAVREDQSSVGHDGRPRRFLSAARVLAQSSSTRPNTQALRRTLNPRVAARDKWKRIEALSRLGGFLGDYRQALAKRAQGWRDVVFPAGTYWLRVAHGVACATAS